MNKIKNTKGITLIALVITIIVLLILAGVTISTLTGDNGILSKAQSAKIKNEKASEKEQIELAVLTSRINNKNNAEIDEGILQEELEKLKANKEIKEYSLIDDEFQLPCVVTGKSGTKYQILEESGIVEELRGISLSQTKLKMVEGQTETITATLTEGVTGTIIWTSSNTNVATVSGGTITAVGTSGTAEITASVEGTDYSAKCTVTIVQKVSEIKVSDLTVEEESSSQLTVTTTPSSNIEDLTYLSDNENIATVDSTGKVTGVAEGTATITVVGKISTTVKGTCTVTVTKPKGLEVGDFVKYNVTYTDMYSDADTETEGVQPFEFSATNGWRVLNPGTKENGKYTGVKLISTGIPAKFEIDTDTIRNFLIDDEGTVGKWGATREQANEYLGPDPNEGTGWDKFEQRSVATGLYDNFSKILFKHGTTSEENYGCFDSINDCNEGNLSGDVFRIPRYS